MTTLSHPTPITAPTGTALSCKGWHQEAALRMLMNNLDPAVAERPEELVVYGGGGKAARNWECYERIVAASRDNVTSSSCFAGAHRSASSSRR